ncbi:hypothetical protein DAEQUDRAFT_704243 [Daedalea quercina L-15889]|uniref:FHA domain-containing protein n=1 Tax=Daedalea quercina L-15889 TaxID=1314783 RepID=A0A165TAM6_9APHY|nr:hypothetical protein DAEQUDRAFT_704243 [Daedalea quercina L-15889]
MEEGEIHDFGSSGVAYSPELEWPGDTTPESSVLYDTIQGQPVYSASESPYLPPASPSPPTARNHLDTSCLRLLVQRSTVLPRKRTLAVLDGCTQIHIGRDVAPSGSETPRIRLKEMEVSKLHATLFWDHARHEWAVVDMGSKHGTFLKSHRGPTALTSEARIRLSAPRIASMPRRLAHLDVLSVGGTTFLVHVHEQIPCAECSPSVENEIPLFDRRAAERQAEASRKRKLGDAEVQLAESSYIAPVRDSKRALNDLRRNLLSRHVTPQNSAAQSRYMDRSALRRTHHPDTAPIIQPSPALMESATIAHVVSKAHVSPLPVSAPPTPLPDSNIGHRLLMKQGWSPGESLGCAGSSDIALLEPLDVKANQGKTGLGGASHSSATYSPPLDIDWKEAGKLRHWNAVRAGDLNGPL